ncbi:hypothetical protein [Ascidiaceihabitans sp.]|uniref:hypothetical protein n=1 Tax=Ascidiaceihabitans sp. TaxID=1872644 RepID=UPI003296E08F
MNTTFLAVALAATTALVPAAQAKESIFVVSPFATAAAKQDQIRAIGQFLAETTEAGETSHVLNGWSQETIASFKVPGDSERYTRASSRMRANPTFFKDMKAFAETPPPAADAPHIGQIDWPAVLRRVGRDFAADIPRNLIFHDVSAVYHDVRSPEFSMRGGVLFSEAHLEASRDATPFGALGQSDYLTNYTVHWGVNDGAWIVSDRHAHHAERIMSWSVSTRGGVLATFANDGATALENARSDKSRAIGAHHLNSDGRLSMIGFQRQAEAPAVSIYDRVLSDRTPALSELEQARDIEIAIRWTCACDFDLAVKPQGGKSVSFRAPSSAQGQLFKDFTSSSSLSNGWETIALTGPVDLTRTIIAANLFSGTGGRGEIRIAIAGETWAAPFEVTGRANSGDGFEQTMASGNPANMGWAVLAAAQIMGANQ